jgi:hypothetical protein
MSKKPVKVHQARVVQLPREPGKLEHAQKRDDSWANIITGIGTGQDKRLGNRVLWDVHTPEFYEQAYAGSALMARIVDLIPTEALRKWVDWVGVERDQAEEIEDRCQELDMRGAIQRAWTGYAGSLYSVAGGGEGHRPARPLALGFTHSHDRRRV